MSSLTHQKTDSVALQVIFIEQPLNHGKRLGLIRLNQEASLNALTFEMIKAICLQLDKWRNDDAILSIWLEGTGERAFCAGGNVVEIYTSLLEGNGNPTFVEDYFTHEYNLDYLIHNYPKPVICWGSGIVMGGGMGLFMASDFRLVTESAKIAMPEINIGLFPDVGASYFLNKLDPSVARFIALTACHLNAKDAMQLNLATHYLPSIKRTAVLNALASYPWDQVACTQIEKHIASILEEHIASMDTELPDNIGTYYEDIRRLMSGGVEDVFGAMQAYKPDCAWMQRAKDTFLAASALSAHVTLRQLDNHRTSSLKEAFQAELSLVIQMCTSADFKEGVRALLVDKDKAPNWRYSDVMAVDIATVDELFMPLWPEAEHPFYDF